MLKRIRRYPSVVGIFYEPDKDALRSQIEWCFQHPLGPGNLPEKSRKTEEGDEIKALIVPHAGVMYSGPIAAHAYYELALSDSAETFVIIGPNHTGLGAPLAVYPGGEWVTPLGAISVDEEFVEKLAQLLGEESIDEKAHLFEHSIEVQLPFLQYLFGNSFRIVAITMYDQSIENAKRLAEAVYEAEKELNRRIVVIATSDLSHYVTRDEAYQYDKRIISAIEELDAAKVYETIMDNTLPVCGLGPIVAAIHYSLLRGAQQAKLLAYATSGDIAGGDASVVGYASIKIT